ncbi:MAG: hypothetical protein HZA24_04405 [Nitrospirae bacterium]|nr:hypothetical protein [Nitrospirota bacterium]
MSLLHILRSENCADALAVIRAQAEAGVKLAVVLEGSREAPAGVPVYFLGADAAPGATPPGTEPIDWAGVARLIFAADTVVTW